MREGFGLHAASRRVGATDMTMTMKHHFSIGGTSVPAVMYGTAWKEERTTALTRLALQSGFVAIDTANQRKHYVEAAVGEAIRFEASRGVCTREGLFLQTKFTYARGQDERLPYDPKSPLEAQVRSSVASSLDHLSTPYIDSFLLHGPENNTGITEGDIEVWRTMESLHDTGTLRLLGVSNVNLAQITELFRVARVKPAFVQNRCYAHDGWDRQIRVFCDANGIRYQAFSLLTANRRELRHRDIETVVRRTGTTTEALVFRFALSRGMISLTGTSSAEHMMLDLEALNVEVDERDLRTVEWISLA